METRVVNIRKNDYDVKSDHVEEEKGKTDVPESLITDTMDLLYIKLTELRLQVDKYQKQQKRLITANDTLYFEINRLLSHMNDRLLNGEKLKFKYPDDNGNYIKVTFHSDTEGNYYFNNQKVHVEYDSRYGYKMLKSLIKTNIRRPVDFFFDFLDKTGLYSTYGNVFYPSRTIVIAEMYTNLDE